MKPHCEAGARHADGDTDVPRTCFESGNVFSCIACCTSLLCQQQSAPKTSSQGLDKCRHFTSCLTLLHGQCSHTSVDFHSLWKARGGLHTGEGEEKERQIIGAWSMCGSAASSHKPSTRCLEKNTGAKIMKQCGLEDKLPPTPSSQC